MRRDMNTCVSYNGDSMNAIIILYTSNESSYIYGIWHLEKVCVCHAFPLSNSQRNGSATVSLRCTQARYTPLHSSVSICECYTAYQDYMEKLKTKSNQKIISTLYCFKHECSIDIQQTHMIETRAEGEGKTPTHCVPSSQSSGCMSKTQQILQATLRQLVLALALHWSYLRFLIAL